jgi:hypothetical protein
MQVSSILSQGTAIGLTISWLSPLQDTRLITTIDPLQTVDFWHINMTNLPQVIDYKHEKIFTTTLNQLDVLTFRPFP